jgi:hypothetical protein
MSNTEDYLPLTGGVLVTLCNLAINGTSELELFIMKDRPERVRNPEAYILPH